MKKALIIHGAYGKPDENWIPWLKQELEKREYEVVIPRFPTPENQSLDSWSEIYKEYNQHIDTESILIGHSIGATFILSILEKRLRPVKGTFFVAGFISSLENEELNKINSTFYEKDFDWDTIKKNAGKVFIYGSDNDPYVSEQKIEELSQKLDAEPIIIEEAGHFNNDSGYTEFEDLLIDIISLENLE